MKEGKNNRKPLLVGIIAAVLVLGVLLALVLTQCVGGQQAETTAPSDTSQEVETYELYWNIDRKLYDGKSEAGLSSRAPEADGYFYIDFFFEGEHVTLRAMDRKIVNAVDAQDLMGLEVDADGLITNVLRLDDMPLERVAWQFYVQSSARTLIKTNSSEKFNGMEVMLEDLDPNRIWDMTGKSGEVGCVAETIKYDKVMAIANYFGEITHVYICDRPYFMTTHEAECQHCKKTVTWSEWTLAETFPKEGGHYQLQNDIQLKAQASLPEDAKVCLDLNGFRIDGKKGSRVIIMNNPSVELAIMDTSEAQTGVIAASGTNNMGMGIMVRHGALYLYSGTIDASKAKNTSGTAVSVSKDRFFYMYGGKIIGGTAACVQNPDTGAFESGAGGAVYVSGKFVMYDGIIEKGRATSLTSYKNGAIVYNRGLGGNVYLASGAEFEMFGGTIKGGKAGSYGGNIGSDGTSTITIHGGTITGGEVTGDGRMGGNIYASSKVTLTLNGGSVTDGKTQGSAGNIYCSGVFNLNGGYIAGGKTYDPATGKRKTNANYNNIYLVNGVLNVWGGYVQGGVSVIDTSATDARTATIYLNGAPQITESPNGIDLNIANNRVVVNVGTLYTGAKIGINAKHGVFTMPTKAENADKFYSNIEGADILHFEECLALGRLGCVCGKEVHSLGCDGKVLVWVPHSTGTDLPTTSGNYYLTKELNLKKGYVVSAGEDVKLDTNGFNVTYKVPSGTTAGFRLYRSDNASKLTITDTTDKPGTWKTIMPAAGTKYTGNKLLKAEVDGEKIYFEPGSAEEQAEAERLWAAGDYGSLLWARGGEINIINGVFDGTGINGNREQGGMVIYVANSTATDEATGNKTTYPAVMNIYGGTIKGGDVNSPGNIAVKENAQLNIYGGTIEGGKANKGGALYISGKTTIYGGTITGGSSVTSTGTPGDGGNIYVGLSGELTVEGGTITGGKADIGGNIFVYGTAIINGGVIEKGEATKCGGNVGTNSGKSAITIGGTAIIRDGYGLRGGNLGLYVRGNKTFTIGGEAMIVNGEAKEYGGNISVASWLDDPSNVVMTGGTVTGGKAPMGGNIYLTGGSSGCNANFTATGGLIEKGDSVNGANIGIGHGSAVVTLKGVTVHNTKASAHNILVDKGTLNIEEGTAITNEAAGTTNIRTSPTADTVSHVVMAGGTVSGGTNSNMSIYSGDTLVITGGTVSGGKAADGGNIKINSATLEITGGTVTGGEATGSGGNIYVGNGTATITGGLIEKGKAATAGGNLCTNVATSVIAIGGTAAIENGESNRGGNVAVHSRANAGFTIDDNATITGGVAKTAGGNLSLYLGSVADASGSIIMNGGTISGGKAPNGGNVCLKGKDANVTATFVQLGGSVENGISTGEGANIYTENGFTAMELSASVNGGVLASGGVTLKGAPTIDKTGTEYAYSIKLNGVSMDADGLTGGKVYVTAEAGTVVATNATEDMLAYILSEVTENDTPVEITYNESTLFMGQIKSSYCACGATKNQAYDCHCAEADRAEHEWTAWSGTALPTATGNYYLTDNVDLATVSKPEANAVIRIDLRGNQILLADNEVIYDFTGISGVRLVITDSTATPGSVILTGTSSVTGGIMKLSAGNTFALYRATLDTTGYDTGTADGSLAYISSNATFEVYSGQLVGNNNSRLLHVNGTANLFGGSLTGGKMNIRLNNANAKVKLQGTTITNAVDGATNVRIDNGTLTIAEGTTISNTAAGVTNVYCTGSGTAIIEMTGGTVTGGTNSNVILNNGDSFTMSGGVVSNGTAANGGNFYVAGNGILTVNGGTISGGTATGGSTGANICLNNDGSQLVLVGVTIPGGIHANDASTVTLKNTVTVDKGDSGCTYSLRMGSRARLILSEMTGGAVYVTGDIGNVIAENVTTNMTAYILSDKAESEVVWNQTEQTLALEAFVTDYCTCGASKRGTYQCHCAEADKGSLTWQAWEGTDALPTATGNYYLTADVTLTAETVAKPANDAVIRIDLKGRDILLENDENLYDFTEVTGVRLVITDSSADPGSVTITGTTAILGGILDLTEGNTFALYRATLDATGLTATTSGGSIIAVQPGAFFGLYSGEALGSKGSMILVNGQAELLGGTVTGASIKVRLNHDGAKVRLAGVAIPNDVASATSVRVDKGELTIAEGTTITNTAAGSTNVGTTDAGVARIIMTGGTISGGTNSNVRVLKSDIFEMSGGIVTGGSAANGGNFYVAGGSGAVATLVISGGTVENGTADAEGANIRLNNGSSALVLDNVTIAGGIHSNAGAPITLRNQVNVDKTGTDYAYSIKTTNASFRFDLSAMTGGTVYVTSNKGNILAQQVNTDMSANILSEKSDAQVVYDATAKTLTYKAK